MSEQVQEFPSREQIERRAYEIYLQRGRGDGNDVADWILAEQELRAATMPAGVVQPKAAAGVPSGR